MAKKYVDFAGSAFPSATLDTGSTAAASIRPIINGEAATQATLQRPDENLRARTEIIRTELENLKYLSQADRAMVVSLEPVSPVGTVLWTGIGTGTFSITTGKRLTLRPFLAPRISTPAKVISRGVKFQTNLTVAGPINPPRAYGNANKYNVQFVNQSGAPVTVTYDPLLFRFTINTDTAASTKTAVINAFNAAATTAGQGITATIDSGFGGDIFASGETFVQGGLLDYLVFAGAADAELHEIDHSTLASFFVDAANAMVENDVLAIWYDSLIDDAFGGRQQSIADAPESPTIEDIPVGSLFLARRFPERLHNAIPVATVVAGQLLLVDGTLAPVGLATPVTGGGLELPAPVAALPPRMLQMDAAGPPHNWGDLNDNKFVGGLQTVATIAARDAIDASQIKEGMVVYSQFDDRHYVREGGVWVEAFTDTYIKGGLRVVADLAALATIPSRLQTAGMLVLTADTRDVYALQTPAAPPIPAANWRLLFRATGTSSAGVPRGRIQLDELGVATSTDNPPDDHAKVSLREMRALRLSMLSTDGSSCSRVLTGCALTPIFGATHPLGRLNPGTILLPNDIVATIDELDVDLGLSSGYVEGAVPGAYPCNVYIFVRRKAGEFSAVLRASVTPPTYLGRLGVTPSGAEGAAYTTGDYGYVGMLRPIAATGVDHTAVWGGFAVSHYGNGVRKVVFGDLGDFSPLNSMPLYVQTTSAALAASTQALHSLLSGPVATAFPTCFQVDACVHMTATPGSSNGDYNSYVRGHGLWMYSNTTKSAGHKNIGNMIQIVTLAKNSMSLKLIAQASASPNPDAMSITSVTWVSAMYENVNEVDMPTITFSDP
jgi:hypothetical protein